MSRYPYIKTRDFCSTISLTALFSQQIKMGAVLRPTLLPFQLLLLFLTLLPSSQAIFAPHPHISKPRPKHQSPPYKIKSFTQTLDHFDYTPQSYQKFQQRYLINDSYWGGKEKQSPFFVFLGHGDDIEFIAARTGLLYEIAPAFNALIVFIEHRYYGKSAPFGSLQKAYSETKNLGYLNSAQALADVATLITSLKVNLSAVESPVVVFGGGDGGILATWFRLKYPHVALGALASSAPVLLYDDVVSPYKLTNIITEDYKNVSENCYKVIRKSWGEIEKLAATKDGNEKLTKTLRLCKNKDKVEDMVANIFSWIELALLYAAMSDYTVPTNIHVNLPAYPVKKMCDAIDHPEFGYHPISRLYGAMNVFYNSTGKEKCFDMQMDDTETNFVDAYGSLWQGCTEMILQTQPRNDHNSLFPTHHKHKFSDMDCERFFGIKPRPHWITTEYGGKHFKKVLKKFASNIIFYNGLRDPLSGGSITESISKNIIALTASEGAHISDLLFSTKNDPEWLEIIRKKEVRIIQRWLERYYTDAATL